MVDKIKALPKKILEKWNSFTSKQKTIIVSVAAVIIVALILLSYFLTRTTYVTLTQFSTTSETASAKDLLDSEGITYKVSADGYTIKVDKKQLADARLVLGKNGIASDDTDFWSDVFDNGLSTTESEKVLKAKLAKEKEMSSNCSKIDGVKQATVSLVLPDTSTSIFKEESKAYVSALLTTTDSLDQSSINGIATYLATAVGLDNTDNVRIIDQTGTLLFAGKSSSQSSAVSNSDEKSNITSAIEEKVRNILLSSGVYNDGNVAASLDISFDEQYIKDTHYYVDDDADHGPTDDTYQSETIGSSGSGGVVGTDSNDDTVTDYDINTGSSDGGSATILKETYSTSNTVTETNKAVGVVNTDNSSISVVLNQYVIYDEDELKANGELKGTTFEKYKAEHSDKEVVEVDDTMYDLVAKATGISSDNIVIVAYKVPIFYPSESSSKSISSYILIILTVLIVALLGFVVFKGMKPQKEEELEPELSVETLLATTKQNQPIEDIEFNEKSQTRQQIEKFVEENPEAVASLLRNWLSEDWE